MTFRNADKYLAPSSVFRRRCGCARAFTYYSREHGTRAATLPGPFTYADIVLLSRTLFSPLSSVSLMDEDTRYESACELVTLLYWRAGSIRLTQIGVLTIIGSLIQ